MTTRRNDLVALLILLALWLLFFWRLFTPIEGDQASIQQGDFSGQFVAFAAYQYERFSAGEVPLWNPYNNGGLPFIGDTQAAVFYPPRLATIALSRLAGGWSYHALELEMTVHVLLYSLLLYLLMRRMTLGKHGSIAGSLVTAIVGSYGGFMTGYPQLQLAILEAGIWLPLGVLGILEATRQVAIRWRWLLVSGFALGLSWMAGHPQTSWFLTYLLVAYLAYRSYTQKYRWSVWLRGVILIGLISGGMAAVQLLPGFEYLAQTARVDFTYEAKGNGFPFQDLLQVVFPGQLSLFSPLYIGVSALALVLISFWQPVPGRSFWAMVALIALLLSFGANTTLFPAFYNLLPGLRFFRGQERAAYLVASSLAILAGLSLSQLIDQHKAPKRKIRSTLIGLLLICAARIPLAHTAWLGTQQPDQNLNIAVFSTIIAALTFSLILNITRPPVRWLFVGLLVFELFSMNMDQNYDPIPPQAQLDLTPPPFSAQVIPAEGEFYRVDGFRGIEANYGSLYNIPDMRGISPLFLAGPFELIEPDKINPLAWELFAVRYVYTDWEALPSASDIIAVGEDRFGPVNLHELSDPRPFAQLVYQAEIIDSDEFAYALLRDPNFNPRDTVILNRDPNLELPDEAPEFRNAAISQFEPEQMRIEVSSSENALLSLAHPDYPGWEITLDGTLVEPIRAYGALTAIPVPAGEHTIELLYNPLSYRIGAILSLFTWISLGILAVLSLVIGRRTDNGS